MRRFLGAPPIAFDIISRQVDHADAVAGHVERHRRGLADLDLDLGVVEAAVGEALAEAGAGRLGRALAGQRVEQALDRRILGGVLDRVAAALALEPDRFLDQIARDLLDVAADIADLGELGRLDLDERRVGKLRQPPADLGLAAARRPDHQDVLGRHFVAQFGDEPLPPPAIAQRHRDGFLGVGLADDMLVERGDDRLGGQIVVHCSVRSSESTSDADSLDTTLFELHVSRSLVKTHTSAAIAIARRASFSGSVS